jgi:hypothetical protein
VGKAHADLEFGPWTPWSQRSTLRSEPPRAGVYLFAHFRSAPSGPPSPERLPTEVIYVGEAKSLNHRPLSGRHHRVDGRYRTLFNDPGKACLYLSVAPLYASPTGEDALAYACERTRSCYLESALAWRYTELHGHPPVMQVKELPSNKGWIQKVVGELAGKE